MLDNVKWIVVDLDGTLLDSDGNIDDGIKDLLPQLEKRGIQFSIASGRIPKMMDYFVDALGVKNYWISANGAYITDGENILSKTAIDKSATKHIVQWACEKDLVFGLLTPNRYYYYKEDKEHRILDNFLEYNRQTGDEGYGVELIVVQKEEDFPTDDVLKILIYCDDNDLLEEAKKELNKWCVEYSFSRPSVLDITPEGVDKGTGLEVLKNHYHLKKEDVLSFGDYGNDLPLFKASGHSVAMGNSLLDVQKAADDTTLTNDDNGVSHYLEKVLKE